MQQHAEHADIVGELDTLRLQRGFNGRQSLGHGSAGYLAASFKTFDCVERNYGLLCEVAPIPRKETTRSAPRTSLDNLVGATEQRLRNIDAEHPGSMRVDD
jgi:hypothetical protein